MKQTMEEAAAQNALNGLITQTLFMLDQQTGKDQNTNYKPLYYGLFNGISAIIEKARTLEQAVAMLKQLQSEAEERYVMQAE
ncbi:MAG: hypothetical protein FWG31_07930 [Oscillospiraceae bacterium]|nr:hypothetical protein [Oscillospiraceae bacterium]